MLPEHTSQSATLLLPERPWLSLASENPKTDVHVPRGRAHKDHGTVLELLVTLAGELLDCEACALRSDAALWGLLQRAMVRARLRVFPVIVPWSGCMLCSEHEPTVAPKFLRRTLK